MFAGALGQDFVCFVSRQCDRRVLVAVLRHETSHGAAAFHHVLDRRVTFAGVVVGRVVGIAFQLFVSEGQAEVVTEELEVVSVEFLHLVRRVTGSEVRSQSVALDRLGQDHGGFAVRRLHRFFVGGVKLVIVVSASLECPDLVVREIAY